MTSQAVLSMRNEERAMLKNALTTHLLHFKWEDALIVRSFSGLSVGFSRKNMVTPIWLILTLSEPACFVFRPEQHRRENP